MSSSEGAEASPEACTAAVANECGSGGQALVLSVKQFDDLCSLSMEGKLKEVEDYTSEMNSGPTRVGPNTFCLDAKLQRPSPFVLAAQYGHKGVVDYFLTQFGGMIDIDHAASIVSLTTKKKVHCATALWAASTGGHLDIVTMLVERGALVNKPTLTQSTPLRGASFHGHLTVMKYLLDNGAEINTPNCIGQSPLCIAAMRGQQKAVEYLVNNGANVNQTTINGYSVMHLAATKGRVDIVRYLLSIGLSPLFSESAPFLEEYIPCPLFLAASTGQRKMVEELVARDDCPPSCRSDAFLLLGATRCEISSRGLTMTSREMWERGLAIRDTCNLTPQYLPAIDNYGGRTEIQSLKDLHSMMADLGFTRHESYFQCLIIRERCMGYADQGLVYFLIRRGGWFCQQGHYVEAEMLWSRAMDMEVKACETEISHSRFGHSEGLQRDLEKDISQYALGIFTMVQNKHRPDFKRYVEFGFKELEILEVLQSQSSDIVPIDFQVILGIILYIFMSWIHFDVEVNKGEDVAEGCLCSRECEELGSRLIQKYLYSIRGSTLLIYALSNFTILEDDEDIIDKYSNLSVLIEAMLQWGADEAINTPDSEGTRPLHAAVALGNDSEDTDVEELVSPLIAGGAHVDAVGQDGCTAFELCTNDVVRTVLQSCGPLPLFCQSAVKVVSEGLPYGDIGLPSHVVTVIRLHDEAFILQQRQV